ncbi:hypothetical protein ACWGQL_38840 [Streptomyces lydicus]
MPTVDTLPRFTTELQHLTPEQSRCFHLPTWHSFPWDNSDRRPA